MPSEHMTRQQPLGTPYSASSTVDDVLADVDLTGRRAVVTGGGAGLGLETVRGLAGAGAAVTVGVRDTDRAATALADVASVSVEPLDLADPDSIDAFARRVLATGGPLHLLVNNAGLGSGSLVRDARGHEMTFSVCHLGHFALTLALRPALVAAGGARVVTVASGGHRLADVRWDDPDFAAGVYDNNTAYGQAKTANVLHAVELDRRWAADGVRAFAVHPGIAVATTLARGKDDDLYGADELRAQGLVDDDGNPVIDPETERKTPAQAAATVVFAATSPWLDGLGGLYLKNSDVAPVDDTPPSAGVGTAPITDVAPHAIDPDSARRLWVMSEEMLGLPVVGSIG